MDTHLDRVDRSLEELTKVEDFPINKYEIIKLYLHL